MRIGLVSNEFAPFKGWGAGTYASLMVQALCESGHEVHVFSAEPAIVRDGPTLRPDVHFHAINLDTPLTKLRAYPSEPMRYAYGAYLALKEIQPRLGLEYIEFPDFLGEAHFALRGQHTIGALQAGAVEPTIGVRLHAAIRDIRAINRDGWLDRERCVTEAIETSAIQEADILSAPCHAMLEFLRYRMNRRIGASIEAGTGIVVRNPFSRKQLIELGRADESPRDPWVEPSEPVVLFNGRLEHRKGVHTLIQAAQRLFARGSVFRVRLLGSDTPRGPLQESYAEGLQAMIEPRWANRFEFRGRVERREMAREIDAATVVVMPSVWENFPYACVEAMALGACVIGSAAGGMAEMIQADGERPSGLLFRGGEGEEAVASLVDQIDRALGDRDLRVRCRENAPGRIWEICDPVAIASQTVEHVRRVREASGGRARAAAGSSGAGVSNGSPRGADVSILVPVYNSHHWLEETLDSIAKQTVLPREVIAVDDGSTDKATVHALATLAKNSPLPRGVDLRVLSEPHRGLSGARNAALRAAAGAFVLPVDSDDVIEPRTIELMRLAMDRRPALAWCSCLMMHFVDDPWSETGNGNGWIPLGAEPDLLAVFNGASHSTAIIRAADLRAVGGYDESLTSYEDWDLYCRFAAMGKTGSVIPEYLLRYRVRPGSLMQTMGRDRHELLRCAMLAKNVSVHPLRLNASPNREAGVEDGFDAGRALRALQADLVHVGATQHEGGLPKTTGELDVLVLQRAREMISYNVRYRLADRLNDWARSIGVKTALKRFFSKRV